MATTTEMDKQPQIALSGKALEDFVVKGNLSVLSPQDKAAHYISLCNSLGLNPATKPFEYLTLNGKEVLYATKGCTDQLRKLHCVSIKIVGREEKDGVFYVYAQAKTPDGREDEDVGAVNISGLKGNDLANAHMKTTTKAKRRVTLSILGLNMLDESELDTIQDRFVNLTKEDREPARVLTIEPKRESRQGEGLDEIPASIGVLPVAVMQRCFARLNGLEGIKLSQMADDDLDLVIDEMRKQYAVRAPSKQSTKLELEWYRAIAEQAKAVLAERNNPPPPEEA